VVTSSSLTNRPPLALRVMCCGIDYPTTTTTTTTTTATTASKAEEGVGGTGRQEDCHP